MAYLENPKCSGFKMGCSEYTVLFRAHRKKIRGNIDAHIKWKVKLGIFSPYFTHLLYVLIYTRPQTFVQLPTTLMKVCHIKRDQQFTSYAQNVCHRPKRTLPSSSAFKGSLIVPSLVHVLRHFYY